MKKLQVIALFIILFSAFTFTSCDDEAIDSAIDLDGIDDGNGNLTGTFFKADFSGSTWTAQNTSVVFANNTIVIEGTRGSNGEGFEFIINGTTVGNYLANNNIVSFTPANSPFGYLGFNVNNVNENTGSVTITSINTTNQTISGVFNYKGYWTDTTVTNILPIIFTNGVFNNLPYTNQIASTDSFFANVDGINFIESTITANTVNNVIRITAANTSNQNITVGIRDNVTPGVYPITGNIGTDVVQASYKFGATALQAYTGSVTVISKTATRIRGTFNFTSSDGLNQYQISQGQFDVNY